MRKTVTQRTNNPRSLTYRQQIKSAARLVQVVASLLLLLCCLFVILFFMGDAQSAVKDLSVLLWAGVFLVLSLVMGCVYHFGLKPYVNMRVRVFPRHLTIKKKKKTLNIDFDQVVEIKKSLGHGLSGWVKLILKNGKTFKYTTFLERGDYILEALYYARPDLLDKAEYLAMRRLIVLCDHRYARHKEFFQGFRLLVVAFVILIVPLVLSVIITWSQIAAFDLGIQLSIFAKTFFACFLICAFASSLSLYFADRRIDIERYGRLRKNIADKRRDYRRESIAYWGMIAPYVFTLIFFITPLYTYDLNLLSTVRLSGKADFLDMKPGELLWIDARSVCLDCEEPLRIGDTVLTSSKYLTKIEAFPGTTVQINKREIIYRKGEKREGRFLSSVEEVTVPENHVAVLGYQGNYRFLLSLGDIKGLALERIKYRR